MSIQAVLKFSQIAEGDPDIKKSLEAATDAENLINLAVELGSQKDLSFTAEDVKTYYSEEQTKRVIPKITKSFTVGLAQNRPNPNPCDGLPYLARQICLQLLNQ